MFHLYFALCYFFIDVFPFSLYDFPMKNRFISTERIFYD